ncbi:MAG TPA: adenylate/guanylate cyclase domain-containing protein [Solimonas sp.]|nr:adenylate/guanylate cyclase domain-containing protein [Solimonas sp.]
MSSIGERLSGFIDWPMSQRLFLLGSGGVMASIFAALVNALLFSTAYPKAMNLELLNGYIKIWIVAQLLITAAVIPPARAGREGRWAACQFLMVQSPFIVGLLQLYGTMGTPLVAIYPAIVILWTLVLDERMGLFGACNLVAWLIVVGVLEALQVLPYAPMLLERSIDSQNNPVWFAAVFTHILVLLGFCVSLCILYQRTQRRQQQRMQEAHVSLAQANRLIRRYVPARLAEQISSGAHDESTRPERRKLTIVFIGIDDFNSAAEELEAEDLAAILGEYLSEMVAIADRHDGTMNHVLGHGMLILFGAPQATNDRDHALRAIRMAQEMQQRVAAMQGMWSRHGLDRPFRIRVGINTGYVSVGDFGSQERKLYSGIGLQTNVTERIQEDCRPGQILISHTTWALVQDEIRCSSQADIPMQALGSPLRVYTLQAEEGAQAAADAPVAVALPAPGFASMAGSWAERSRHHSGVEQVWNFGNAHFDEASLVLALAGAPVELERKPLEVLRYLLRHAGDLVTKDELCVAIWPGRIPSETVVAKSISRLREVLQDDSQSIIKTVHGYGYRFVAEITHGNPRAC